jgi:NAD(P)-dependent dehydrogenase (short-subunit alcohol dehydrogenase family)
MRRSAAEAPGEYLAEIYGCVTVAFSAGCKPDSRRNVPLPFEGKVVLVTGAAQGLGRAVALAFAREGAAVAVADRDVAGAAATAGEVRNLDRVCCVIDLDLVAPDAPRLMVTRAVAELGRLDVLVNNAATWAVEPFLEITEDAWDKVFAVNVKALQFSLLAAARQMMRNGGGRIVNISSPASRMGLANYAAYAASKAAVDSITRSASVALGRHQITVNCVAPGRMDTDMQQATEQRFAALAGVDLASFVEARTKDVPLGRRTTPEEVAQAVLWLAGPHGAYVTGARLNISGGLELN